jgi:hypothetical protein
MRRRARALPTLALLLLAAGCQRKPVSLQEFTPEEGGFTVLMPGKPQKKSLNIPTAQGNLPGVAYGVEVPNGAFVVGYFDIPPGGQYDCLAGVRGVADQFQGEVTVAQEGTFAGGAGREFEIAARKPKGYVCGRIFVVRNRVYMLHAMGGNYHLKDPDVRQFLDSFRLADDRRGLAVRPEQKGDGGPARPPRQDGGGQPVVRDGGPRDQQPDPQPQPGVGQPEDKGDWVVQCLVAGRWTDFPMSKMRHVVKDAGLALTNTTGVGDHAGVATRRRFGGDCVVRVEVWNAKSVGLKSAVGDGAWAGVDLPVGAGWSTVVLTRQQGQVAATVNGRPARLVDVNSRALGEAVFYVHVRANESAEVRNFQVEAK